MLQYPTGRGIDRLTGLALAVALVWAPSEVSAQRYGRAFEEYRPGRGTPSTWNGRAARPYAPRNDRDEDFDPDGPLYDEDVVGPWYDLDRFDYRTSSYGLSDRRVYDPFEDGPRDEGMYGPRGFLDPGPYGGYAYGFYDRLIGGDDWFYDYYDYGSDYGAIRDFGNYGGVPNRRQFGWGSNQPGYY